MSEKNERPRIPSLQDVRIIRENGTEWPLGEVEANESKPAEPDSPAERLSLGPWSGSATGKLTPEGEAWLRYQLLVRPWLYCPLEYRLN